MIEIVVQGAVIGCAVGIAVVVFVLVLEIGTTLIDLADYK